MTTAKILISIPDDLVVRMRATIPPRKRSALLRKLIEAEVSRREQQLYNAALAAEADQELNQEIADWDVTASDGIDDESW